IRTRETRGSCFTRNSGHRPTHRRPTTSARGLTVSPHSRAGGNPESSRKLLLATRSKGKLHELKPLLAPLGCALLTLDDAGIPESTEEDDLECFDTFEENALAKARYFAARSGLPTVADDSGLEVLAL